MAKDSSQPFGKSVRRYGSTHNARAALTRQKNLEQQQQKIAPNFAQPEGGYGTPKNYVNGKEQK
jgi:hypothetical protein